MTQFLWFLLTMAVAVTGGFLFMKLKVPAGALVGALLFTGVLSVLTGHMFMYTGLKVLTKTVAGLFIGMSVTSESVKKLASLIKPAVILVAVIIILCLGMGLAMYRFSGLDVVTSLFSVAPGGMQDMTLMTIDLEGDAAVVAVMQVLRLLSVYFISMPIVKLLTKKSGRQEGQTGASERGRGSSGRPSGEIRKKRIHFTSLVALAGGAAGYLIAELADFSTLILIVSMVTAASVNLATGKLYMPVIVRRITQMMSGALIGVTVGYDSIVHLKMALVPAVFITMGFVVINVIIAMIISRVCHMDIATAMLSSSAGGASESALVAPDFGADPAIVSVLQVTRLVCVTAFYPVLVKFILPSL